MPAGQVVRVKTGWRNPTGRVDFQTVGGGSVRDLQFDNLTYPKVTPATGP
jgi:hypothetical protein